MNSFMLADLDVGQLDRFELNGGAGDIVRATGAIQAGHSLSFQAGTIEIAGSIDTASGAIWLDAGSEGTLALKGSVRSIGDAEQSGGSVVLLGREIQILNDASIDVSGGMGGGQILVGGDYLGANAQIRNAKLTFVAANARLSADALTLGRGGEIIVWADEIATIENADNIRARGGKLGGEGGLIETSGKLVLKLNGRPDMADS